jgi:hypothetical protein
MSALVAFGAPPGEVAEADFGTPGVVFQMGVWNWPKRTDTRLTRPRADNTWMKSRSAVMPNW